MINTRIPKVLFKRTPSDFIRVELQKGIGDLIKDHPFLSFPLICMSIEFLGKCIDDEHDFKDRGNGLGRKQFNGCITKYMKRYADLIGGDFDLYTHLRCGFAHRFMGGKAFSLVDAEIDSIDKHFDILSDGKMVLKIDEFYTDFSSACDAIINDISNNVLKHKKLNETYEYITD